MGIFLRKNNPKALSSFIKVIKKGGVALHPTDTVYGLGACAFLPQALRRIFLLKGRRPESPFLVLAAPEKISELVSHIPFSLHSIWEEFLSQPITAVLPARASRPYITREGKIAVRVPAEPFLLDALRLLPCPIASTSANPSGRVFSAARAVEYFQDKVDLVLLGKELRPLPSTIIDFTHHPPRLLRRGAYIPKSFPLRP